MCETRNEDNESKRSSESESQSQPRSRRPRNSVPVRGPREGEQWYLVKGGRNNRQPGRQRTRERQNEREQV